MLTSDQVIKKIEHDLNFQLSDEQKAILTADKNRPTLINACAGAGKTTTMMISIIYQIMLNQITPQQVLGITFSKRAQLDMGDKFQKIKSQIETGQNWSLPHFSTFHALFYRLLRMMYPQQRISLVNTNQFQNKLYQKIQSPIDALSINENVARFTDIASKMINYGYSYDGIHVNTNNHNVQIILQNLNNKSDLQTLLSFFGKADDAYYRDYFNVISEYQRLKQTTGSIDFDDMQALVYRNVSTNPMMLQLAQRYLDQYTRLYLDEFQDINPLQWSILRLIVPAQLMQHLVTIGDDDQSIYSFRGSDSGYILNFNKQMPNAQRFNLSTNYRTASDILDIVKPMIESNTLRLTKSLKANNDGGKISVGYRDRYDNTDKALDQFIKDIEASPNQRYAIISRDNLNLSMLSDKLAEHDIYANLGSEYSIFQNTAIYQIIVSVMLALYNDSFKQFYDVSNKIGFSKYKKYLSNYLDKYQKLSDFLASSDSTDSNFATQNQQINRHMQTILIAKNSENKKLADKVMKLLFTLANTLTNDYFSFVINRHYVSYSKTDYENVINYLSNLVLEADNPKDFFALEDMKRASLENVIQQGARQIQAITMHSSKGLEFDETLIYESETSGISDDELILAKKFPAKLSINELKDKLIAIEHPLPTVAMLFDNNISAITLLLNKWFPNHQKAEHLIKNFLSISKSPNAMMALDNLAKEEKKFDFKVLNDDQNLMNLLYMEINTIAKRVEEEKRIYYVGVTRAKSQIIFDRGAKLSTIDQMLDLKKAKQIKEERRDDNDDK